MKPSVQATQNKAVDHTCANSLQTDVGDCHFPSEDKVIPAEINRIAEGWDILRIIALFAFNAQVMRSLVDLKLVRVWLKSHIEGHVKICYLAYSILSYLSYVLEKKEISGPEAIDTMRTCYRVYLEYRKTQFRWKSMVALSAVQKEIMDVVIKKT